jgi:hypothetical protein
VRAQARQAGGDLLLAAAPAARPDRVRRDLTDRDYEIIRPVRRPARPHRHDGSGGSGRGQRTGTSPILGRRSFPLVSALNRALAVNRMACRRS